MTSITFDTHAHVKKLKEKGISEQQAEAFVDMFKEMQDADKSALATKADLSELKAELIKWFVGIGFAQAAMILSILKFHG